jgi:hypothetical protein
MTDTTDNTQSELDGTLSKVWDVLRRLPFRTILLVLVLAFIGLVAWGYSASPTYTPRASSEWSKGRPVGETTLNEVVAAQATSHSTYLVWVDLSRQLHYARLNRAGETVVDTFIAVPTFNPRGPQLVIGVADTLHLTWLDTLEGESLLKYVRLDISGRPLTDPASVSLTNEPVELARLVLNRQGQAEIFWSGPAGIYHTTLDEAGEALRPNTLLVPGGGTPSIQVDGKGDIHLAWLEAESSLNQSIHYALFNPEQRTLSSPVQMTFVFRRVGQSLDGLTMALDDEYGYIFWSITDRRDGASWTEYLNFPLSDSPSVTRAELVLRGVDFIRDAFFLDGQRSKAFVALSGDVLGERAGSQIALAIFRQGQFTGHQIITASGEASLKPVVLTDVMGELHVVWIDTVGFNRYRVLYASTTDQAKRALNVITLWDVTDTVVSGAMSLTLLVIFVPLMIAWSLLPGTLVLVNYFLTRDEDLGSLRSWGIYATAVVLQIAGMMVRPPGISGPFTRYVLPIFLAGVALAVAYINLRVKQQRSILIAFAIFALTHGLLRMVIYALGTIS